MSCPAWQHLDGLREQDLCVALKGSGAHTGPGLVDTRRGCERLVSPELWGRTPVLVSGSGLVRAGAWEPGWVAGGVRLLEKGCRGAALLSGP